MARQLYPVSRIHRDNAFQHLYDRYMEDQDETPFDLVLPPLAWPSVQVVVVTKALGLPEDLQTKVMSYLRVSRVEKLAVHLLFVLDSAWTTDLEWYRRQHRYLKQTAAAEAAQW